MKPSIQLMVIHSQHHILDQIYSIIKEDPAIQLTSIHPHTLNNVFHHPTPTIILIEQRMLECHAEFFNSLCRYWQDTKLTIIGDVFQKYHLDYLIQYNISGWITDISKNNVLRFIHLITTDMKVFDQTIAIMFQKHYFKKLYYQQRRELLTRKQVDIVKLIQQGLTNIEIAHQLDISIKTVETHITKIFRTMDVTSRADLVDDDLFQYV